MSNLTEKMNEILDDKLCALENGFEYGGLVEAIGNDENSRLATTIYLMLHARPDELVKLQSALLEGFHAYFGTDTKAQEVIEAQRINMSTEWYESGHNYKDFG